MTGGHWDGGDDLGTVEQAHAGMGTNWRNALPSNLGDANKSWPKLLRSRWAVTLKAVNDRPARQACTGPPGEGEHISTFNVAKPPDVPAVSSHSVEEWIAEFHRLRQLNERIIGHPHRSRRKRSALTDT
jgi:hypothetical protein